MKALVRALIVVAAGLPSEASITRAGVPDFSHSTIGYGGMVVNLGGMTTGVVDPRAQKRIVIRNNAHQPMAGITVTIDFGSCTSQDIRLCGEQPSHPGALFDCPAKIATSVTNSAGEAFFRIAGGATNPGGNPAGVGSGCAAVRADGVLLGFLTVGAPDEDGSGGINPADLSAFLGDRFGQYRGRSDLDGSGAVNPADLSILLGFRFGDGSLSSCPAGCP